MDKESYEDGVVYHAGFPNAAEDGNMGSLSLDSLVVKHRASTFFWSLAGDIDELCWAKGSILVVDRALNPRGNSLVVVVTDDEFVICRYFKEGFLKLDGSQFDVEPVLWGVVTYVIQSARAT